MTQEERLQILEELKEAGLAERFRNALETHADISTLSTESICFVLDNMISKPAPAVLEVVVRGAPINEHPPLRPPSETTNTDDDADIHWFGGV